MSTTTTTSATTASAIALTNARARLWARVTNDRGQATAEYALLILAAASIALLVIAWATSTGSIGRLFDAVIDSVIGRI